MTECRQSDRRARGSQSFPRRIYLSIIWPDPADFQLGNLRRDQTLKNPLCRLAPGLMDRFGRPLSPDAGLRVGCRNHRTAREACHGQAKDCILRGLESFAGHRINYTRHPVPVKERRNRPFPSPKTRSRSRLSQHYINIIMLTAPQPLFTMTPGPPRDSLLSNLYSPARERGTAFFFYLLSLH